MSDSPPNGEDLAATRAEFALLEAVCQQLTGQGRPARLAHLWPCGEEDVRLLVGGSRAGPDVELLGPYDGAAPDASWCAVEVRSASRIVWSGPRRSCAPADLLGFVDDLQHGDAHDRGGRYVRLG